MSPIGPNRLPAKIPKANHDINEWTKRSGEVAFQMAMDRLKFNPLGVVTDALGFTPDYLLSAVLARVEPVAPWTMDGWTCTKVCTTDASWDALLWTQSSFGSMSVSCWTGQAITDQAYNLNSSARTIAYYYKYNQVTNRYRTVVCFSRAGTGSMVGVKPVYHPTVTIPVEDPFPRIPQIEESGNSDPRTRTPPKTGDSISMPPKGPPTPVHTPHFRRPPRPGEKEKKARAFGPAATALSKFFHGMTEAADLVDALYDALPPQYRLKYRPGQPITHIEKAKAVYDNLDHLDLGKALSNVVANEIQDRAIGHLNQGAGKLPRITGGIPVGYGYGPAF